mmetsp:Transcript_38217/g.92477  ORF Transcript_38217/g.92477 Transcript_38217/m.92477 type:complete len:123 (-) Transcript_38217:6-374(-)
MASLGVLNSEGYTSSISGEREKIDSQESVSIEKTDLMRFRNDRNICTEKTPWQKRNQSTIFYRFFKGARDVEEANGVFSEAMMILFIRVPHGSTLDHERIKVDAKSQLSCSHVIATIRLQSE